MFLLQAVELPPGVKGMDIYIGVALTLFVVDRVMYLFKNIRNGSKTPATSPVTHREWEVVARQVGDMHEWLAVEDPESGAKVWRIPAIELRALRKTLEGLAGVMAENNTVMQAMQQANNDLVKTLSERREHSR